MTKMATASSTTKNAPPCEVPCKSVAEKPVVKEKAVAKVAEKLVVTENVVAIKRAAIADVDLAMATELAGRVTETAIAPADLVLLAKVMANVRNVATAPSVVIVDRAKVVVAAPALVAPVVVDRLRVLDEKATPVALVLKRCLRASTKMAMAN